ncbi:MAG: alpha-galactosidase [Caldilineaceae bacterium]
MTTDQNSWSDLRYQTEPYPTLSFRTAMTVYEESLIHGRLVGRAWNGAGFVNGWEEGLRLDPAKHPTPQAFWLEVDGQLLASHWEWVDLQKKQEVRGLHVILTLRHLHRPVTVAIHTLLDGTPILTRWLEVRNTGNQPAALSAAYPWSGVLQSTSRWQSHLPSADCALYSLGYMENPHWGNEGDFRWHGLPNATYQVHGRYRRDRHRHPMFVLRNNATGEHFIAQLAWSGGYCFEFDLDGDLGTTDQAASLFFRAGPDASAPQRVIAPGETITTPELHLGMTLGDLDSAIQAMHDHLRRSVFAPQPRGRGGWIESGIGPEVEITAEHVFHQIDSAATFGAEVFFIDASWYAKPYSHWWHTVGDWSVDHERFSEGVKPFRDRVHEKGMLWGLWMDAERIGKESQVYKEHPDWLATAYDDTTPLGNMLDLTKPAVAQWMEEQIVRVVSENELDFFRLDYNVGHIGSGSYNLRDGFIENGHWRYYEALYAIYERIRARFPNLIVENCAGGGGRTDIGMIRRFSHTWVTDWQIAPRSFTITNGMTMALPPEYVDRLVAGQNGHITADFDFQSRLLLFVRPTLAFFNPMGVDWNPHQLSRLRHFIDLYKNFVRPFMNSGRIYHHTPTCEGPEPQGWGVLELAAADRSKAIAGVFQLSAPQQSEYWLRLRGLDLARRYRVNFDNSNQTCELDGFTLMKSGLPIRLEGALTSELLRIEAVG